MKRLDYNLESTTPFINSDFNDILQEQHMIAYSAYLDGLNDMKYSTQSTNRGIILSGIEIDATLSTSNPLGGQFDWDVKINKKTALIYFDGQYYTPSDTLLSLSETTDVVSKYTNANALIFYPFTQSINNQQKLIIQNRSYLHESLGPSAGSYGSQSVTIDYRFDIRQFSTLSDLTINIPTSVAPNTFPGATQGLPYIFCSWGGTSRNLSRILKYNTTVKDDIYMAYELKKWATPANLSGILDGFIYRDFAWKITGGATTTYETLFGTGRNELRGFEVMGEIAGRFPVGYDSGGSPTPSNAGLLQFNYGTPSNTGGTQSLTFSNNQIAEHTHGQIETNSVAPGVIVSNISSKTGPPEENLDHSHYFRTGVIEEYYTVPPYFKTTIPEPRGIPLGNPFNPSPSGIFLTRSKPYFDQIVADIVSYAQGGNNALQDRELFYFEDTNYDSSAHWHDISSVGLGNKHENRPPYVVVLYYYKT